jgi:hypothetical protein
MAGGLAQVEAIICLRHPPTERPSANIVAGEHFAAAVMVEQSGKLSTQKLKSVSARTPRRRGEALDRRPSA